jgi:hypothetical protein
MIPTVDPNHSRVVATKPCFRIIRIPATAKARGNMIAPAPSSQIARFANRNPPAPALPIIPPAARTAQSNRISPTMIWFVFPFLEVDEDFFFGLPMEILLCDNSITAFTSSNY